MIDVDSTSMAAFYITDWEESPPCDMQIQECNMKELLLRAGQLSCAKAPNECDVTLTYGKFQGTDSSGCAGSSKWEIR